MIIRSIQLLNSVRMSTCQFPRKIDAESVHEFAAKYDNFLVDCDGVLWHTDHITRFPGTGEALHALREKGKKLVFVSNNSMQNRDSFISKFKHLCNTDVDKKDVFCANYAVAVYLNNIAKIKGTCYIIGGDGLKQELDDIGVANIGCGSDIDVISPHPGDLHKQHLEPDVEAVVVGFDEHFNYNKLYKASSYLVNETCHFLATSTVEVSTVIGDGRRQPLTGSFIAAVTAAAKREPAVIGKPSRHLLDCVLATHPNMDLKRTIRVGDALKTDVAFARKAGIDSLLVLTGASTLRTIHKHMGIKQSYADNFVPDYYMDEFAGFQVLSGIA